jgi:hypothetical protein
MSSEMKIIWQETVVSCVRILSQYLSWKEEDAQDSRVRSRSANPHNATFF